MNDIEMDRFITMYHHLGWGLLILAVVHIAAIFWTMWRR